MDATTGTAPVIRSDRLELQPLLLAQAAAIVNGRRPDRAPWALGYPTESTLVAAGLIVTAESEGQPFGAFGCYQLVRARDGVVVGDAGFLGPPDGDGTIHLNYDLASSQHGRGYAAEAVRALVGWAHEQPGVQRVLADTAVTNLEAIRVLERGGFRRTGEDQSLVYYEA